MSHENSLIELVSRYRTAADQTDNLEMAKDQRKSVDEVHSCYKQLRETKEGRQAIIDLMEDTNDHVRCWAAAHSLQWEPDRARCILELLRDEGTFPCSFDAEMTLEEFDKGQLSFDY